MQQLNGSNGHVNGVNGTAVKVMEYPNGNESDPLPPFSHEAELAVLGGILIDNDAYYDVASFLSPYDFYKKTHGAVFQALADLIRQNRPADMITLPELLKARQFKPDKDTAESFLIGLLTEVPTSINTTHYGRIVSAMAARRRLIYAARTISTSAYDLTKSPDELMGEAETAVFKARGNVNQNYTNANDAAAKYLETFESLREQTTPAGIPTGFIDLDRLLSGLIAPHHYILAARPGMGKSAIAVNMADSITTRGKRVGFFSIEMNVNQVMSRRIAAMTGIDSQRLKRAWELNQREVNSIYQAVGELSKRPLMIDPSESLTPGKIRAKAVRMHAEHGLDLIIVDHLHKLKPDRRLSRSDLEVGEMCAELDAMGKALNVPVLTLAQLNRSVDSRTNKRPTLTDLRESGGIEENAYAVMFLYRDAYYDELADVHKSELIVAKHRDGPTGTINLFWKPETTQFKNHQQQEVYL